MDITHLRLFLPLLAALALLPGTGCSSYQCSADARTSVDVSIVDGNATGITDAVVKYTVDGGPQKDCERFVAEGSVYSCGTEEAGHFVITASHAGATQTKELDVESDECHVIGVDLKLTFP